MESFTTVCTNYCITQVCKGLKDSAIGKTYNSQLPTVNLPVEGMRSLQFQSSLMPYDVPALLLIKTTEQEGVLFHSRAGQVVTMRRGWLFTYSFAILLVLLP